MAALTVEAVRRAAAAHLFGPGVRATLTSREIVETAAQEGVVFDVALEV